MTQRRIYQNEYPYFVTFRTREGFPLFEDEKMAELLADIIFNAGKMKQFNILAYQIMPDHVHLLTYNKNHQAHSSAGALPSKMGSAGRDACARRNYNISQFIHSIKSYYCDQTRDQYQIDFQFFQPRFYTRIVNTDKYLNTVIEYIKYNPIKAELLDKFQKLPYQYFDYEIPY